MALERITVDPTRMGGVPCIRDLRVTVSMVLGQLAAGRTIEELLDDYPYLEREDVLAALEYAAAVVNEREPPSPNQREAPPRRQPLPLDLSAAPERGS